VNGAGVVTDAFEVYDPAANAWTSLPPMKVAVQAAACVALNGQLYVFGGSGATGDVTTVQVYNPFKNKWKTLSALPAAISNSSGVVVDGLAFMVGGDGTATTNQYSAFGPSIP
jgi:N-acetylneuraminic acid mutarotase